MPPALIDATTSIEDKTFWQNAGFDPIGILSAALDTVTGNARGASTITQQLVRNRLLPDSAFAGSTYERKIREIIQSIRLTQELPPGVAGKQQIMEAYLNQNFYGNQSYGIAAAAQSYFGITDLSKLDPGPVGDPGRHPPVAVGLRPGPERRRAVQRGGRQRGRLPGRQDPAGRARPTPRSSSAATTSST